MNGCVPSSSQETHNNIQPKGVAVLRRFAQVECRYSVLILLVDILVQWRKCTLNDTVGYARGERKEGEECRRTEGELR